MASKDLTVRLLGDASNLNRALAGVGNDVSRVGARMTRTLTPAAAAVGLAMGKMGSDFNDARDAIITGTGASGDALDGLLNDTKKVAGQVPQDFGTVGVAIAELNTRLGLTGDELQDVARQALDFSRVTGVDVESAVRTVSRTMKDWGVETENASEVMDLMFKASQETGIGVDRLGDKLVQFGAPLRQIGFSMEESTALLAEFEAQGVNTELVMGGLRQSLGRMARAGEEPAEAFHRLTDEIKNTASEGEATALAMDLFGARAGPDMAAAIREGRFEIADMVAALSDSEGAVSDAASATLRFSDRLQMLRNRVTGVLGPFGEIGGIVGGVVASIGPLLFGLGQIAPKLGGLRSAFVSTGADGTRSLTNLGKAAGALGVALGVAAAAMFVYNQRQQQAAERARVLGDMFNAVSSASDEMISDELSNMLLAAEFQFGSTTAALDAFAESNIEGARRVLAMGDASGLSAEKQELLEEAIARADEKAARAARTSADYGDVTDDLSSSMDDLTDSVEDATRAIDDQRAAQRAAADATFAARREQDRYRRAVEEVNEKVGASTIITNEMRLVLDDATLAAGSQADAQVRIAEETATAAGSTLDAQEAINIWNSEMLRAAATAEGPLRESIIDYIASVNGIPEERVTEIAAALDNHSLAAAEAALNDTARPRTATIRVNQEGTVNLPAGGVVRKSGGPVPGSKSQAVPITAHGGEYVLDAGTVDAIKKGQPSAGKNTGGQSMGGGSTVVINVDGNINGDRHLREMLERWSADVGDALAAGRRP